MQVAGCRVATREDKGAPIVIPLKLFLERIGFPADNISSRVAWKLRGGMKVQKYVGGARVAMSPGGALGYFLGGYVPPGTPNWHPVLKTISPKIDTPF